MGVVNAATTLGQAIAPPILTVTMLAFGWRTMFMLIGIPGVLLSVVWFILYRDRREVKLSCEESAYLVGSGSISSLANISLAQWFGLFKLRTMWGMMFGFGGVNYTVWLYMSWMPNYLEATHHISIAATGVIAIIPFAIGAAGMFLSGVIADFLVRRGITPKRSHKILLVTGMVASAVCTLFVPSISTATGAAFGIGLALFFIYIAGNSGWGLVQCMAPHGLVASVATIQNFGSFVCASFAPVLTGWFLDRTHSFYIPLVLCATISVLGALTYLFIVKDPITVKGRSSITPRS
jgi:cyanate permease